MRTFRNLILLGVTTTTLAACGTTNEPTVGSGDSETQTFRQGLPGADDVQMSYAADGSVNAMAGDFAVIAGMTAQAVVGTNAHMIGHFAMMHAVANLPPTEIAPDFRAWDGEHRDLTMRVEARRSATPRGTRYDYTVAGKKTDSDDDLALVIDGHIVRLDEEHEPRDGFGIVRFHYDNLNDLQPEREIDGKVRVAFRKANRAHQVHVRAIGVQTPNDPHFPPAAEYVYAVRPDTSGALRWFSKSDVKKDSQPLENVAVHSAWRADKSGIGSAVVFGGSLEVDYWHLIECWGSNFVKGYDVLELPELRMESGDPTSCFGSPEQLEPPAFEESLPDEDPEIPAPMVEEDEG